jgi:hypothetical protein
LDVCFLSSSERLQPIQPARAEHNRGRFAYSAARAGDDNDLVFDSRHEVRFPKIEATDSAASGHEVLNPAPPYSPKDIEKAVAKSHR